MATDKVIVTMTGTTTPPVTKFRTLHLVNPPMRGKDVVDAQMLLSKCGYYEGAADGVFGPITGKACKKAKYHLGYATKDIKATYGHPLSGLLAGTIKPPAAYRIRARVRRRKIEKQHSREAILRAKIVANWKWMLSPAAKAQEHYVQLRPIDGEHQPHKLPLRFDCSGAVTDGYAWTPGVSDPNSENFNGSGYTGTVMTSPLMVEIHPSEVKPADIGVYGDYPGKHEVGALTEGPDPNVFSMGREGDPNEYKASALISIGTLRWYTLRKW